MRQNCATHSALRINSATKSLEGKGHFHTHYRRLPTGNYWVLICQTKRRNTNNNQNAGLPRFSKTTMTPRSPPISTSSQQCLSRPLGRFTDFFQIPSPILKPHRPQIILPTPAPAALHPYPSDPPLSHPHFPTYSHTPPTATNHTKSSRLRART